MCILVCIAVWVGCSVRYRKKTLESQDVQFTKKERNILRTRWIPNMCIFVWTINIVMRMLPNIHE